MRQRTGREAMAANLPLEAGTVEDSPRHSVSVTAVVTRDDGRVLVIKRADDGRWVPPGSVLELGRRRKNAAPARSWRRPGTASTSALARGSART
jgi:hypothetical protein